MFQERKLLLINIYKGQIAQKTLLVNGRLIYFIYIARCRNNLILTVILQNTVQVHIIFDFSHCIGKGLFDLHEW